MAESSIGDVVNEQNSIDDAPNPLPRTCTVIEKSSDREVYVVGTAHFSKESQEDVAVVLRTIQPHVVFLELCSNRLGILEFSEERLLHEAKDISFRKLQQSIQANGAVNGILRMMLMSLSANLTQQLGMAPGGEFRRAFKEAQRIPHCKVVYGDRPIAITMKRAIGSLTLLQKLKFAWHMISSDIVLSPEDIEKCKEKDILEQMLAEMAGEFPSLTEVFVNERDIFLANSLKRSCRISLGPAGEYTKPIKVVAVLGIGHVSGVVTNWDKDLTQRAKEVMQVPQPTVAGRVFGIAVKVTLIGGTLYASYKASRGAYRLVNRLLSGYLK